MLMGSLSVNSLTLHPGGVNLVCDTRYECTHTKFSTALYPYSCSYCIFGCEKITDVAAVSFRRIIHFGELSNPRARAAGARCMEKIYGNLRKPARAHRARYAAISSQPRTQHNRGVCTHKAHGRTSDGNRCRTY